MNSVYKILIGLFWAVLTAGCKKEPEKLITGTWKLWKSESHYKYITSIEVFEKGVIYDGANIYSTLQCTSCSANNGLVKNLNAYGMTLKLSEGGRFSIKEVNLSDTTEVTGTWKWNANKDAILLTADNVPANTSVRPHFFMDTCTLNITYLQKDQLNADLSNTLPDATEDRYKSGRGTFIFRKTSETADVSGTIGTGTGTSPVTGTMTDSRDGQQYKTVTIGTQTWMAENLKFPASCGVAYNSDAANVSTYGYLYSQDIILITPPAGWHIPDENDITTLVTYVGSAHGNKLRSPSSQWTTPHSGDNGTGFSFLPCGKCVNDPTAAVSLAFSGLHEIAYMGYRGSAGDWRYMAVSGSGSTIALGTQQLAGVAEMYCVRYVKD